MGRRKGKRRLNPKDGAASRWHEPADWENYLVTSPGVSGLKVYTLPRLAYVPTAGDSRVDNLCAAHFRSDTPACDADIRHILFAEIALAFPFSQKELLNPKDPF